MRLRRDLSAGAACRSTGAELTGLFFSDDPDEVAMAKSICAGCCIAEECLTGATARREPAGVWGGQELRNGQVLAGHARSSRPSRALVGAG
ncbi:MAG: WhiB family transcriptional regulator [Acidimicrobiales bacterium]